MKIKILPFILAIAIIISFDACRKGYKPRKSNKPVPEITQLDTSIDSTNAFNKIFMTKEVVDKYMEVDTLCERMCAFVKSFYNSRNYQYAWFAPEGMPEHTLSFWNTIKNYVNYSGDTTMYTKKFAKYIDKLILKEPLKVKNDSIFQNLDFEFTRIFYRYADKVFSQYPGFDLKSLEWYIPKKQLTLKETLERAINKKERFADANAPVNNKQFKLLRDEVIRYKKFMDQGGWKPVIVKKDLKLGYKGVEVIELKKRLKAEGFLAGADSTFTDVYDNGLANAVNAAKEVYGYKPDGIANQIFIKDLNIPVEERIQQIIVNIQRMRWIPLETNDKGRAAMVNIPEFKLHMYDGGKPVWDMNVVVGKEGTSTTVFTGKINQVVFNPYWNIPPSIVKKEIMPNMSDEYLARNHYEVVGQEDGLPVIRQTPGDWNSLGRVKFLFPNSYNIYFHDTPSKSLFQRDKRSFSHGCIRLSEPFKFAKYVLNNPEWDDEKIKQMLATTEEKFISLKTPIPVLITYFTSWVNRNGGTIHFREDIYGYDEAYAKKLFKNPVKTTKPTVPGK